MSSPAYHVVQAITATSAFLMAEAATAPELDWLAMVERLGLAVALVLFFVWTGWQREQRMAKRIDQLEKQALTLSTKLAALTEQFNETMRRDIDLVAEAVKTLESRPCVAFDDHETFDKWRKEQQK